MRYHIKAQSGCHYKYGDIQAAWAGREIPWNLDVFGGD